LFVEGLVHTVIIATCIYHKISMVKLTHN